jgi:predicted RNase H-like nuclease (RuvC/YqgF family)
MKRILLIVPVAAAMMLTGCENYKQQAEALTHQRDSLLAVGNANNQTIDEYISSFNEVEGNLNAIAQKQNAIAVSAERNPEMAKTTKERINSEIEAINQMMAENKTRVAELEKKLKHSNGKLGKLEKMVATLKEQLTQKEAELASLNQQLSKLNVDLATLKTNFDSLNTQNQNHVQVIADQTTKLHTAFYTVGPYKKLRDQKVVAKQGGVLGLGSKTNLVPAIKNESFTKIDYTQTATIPINSKNAELVTTHPADSYKVERTNDMISDLVITDPDKFWSASKYLVVVTK